MQKVGKYELHEKLGEGGFGRVWKALDTDLEVWRALKEPFDQSPELEAELKEARVQAKLDHPGMVRVLGTERIDGRFFLVTEFVEGDNLRHWLGQSDVAPDLEEADRVLRGILEALDYAHGKGIVHLDLKPENIFMTADGGLKIGDFGLARAVDRALVTVTTVRGTLHYMAPEQLDGKAGPSADRWAAGTIAYELYTGQFAIAGQTQGEILKQVANGTVRDLVLVPEERRELVSALLTADPAQRCESAAAALALLPGGATLGATLDLGAAAQPSRGSRVALPVLLLTLFLGIGALAYGAWFGVIDVPQVEQALAWWEGEPETRRADAEFYALPPTGKLDLAWMYADQPDYPLAYHAAGEVLAAPADPAVHAEALYLRGMLAARYLERPWHAAVDGQRYRAAHPEGAHALAVALNTAEVYMALGRYSKALNLLERVVRERPEDPLLPDAAALAARCEAEVRKGLAPELRAGRDWLASLLPNNLPSLVLTFVSFAAFLLPGLFLVALAAPGAGAESGSPLKRILRSRLHLALFVGFLVFQGLQFYLNRQAAVRAGAQLVETAQTLQKGQP